MYFLIQRYPSSQRPLFIPAPMAFEKEALALVLLPSKCESKLIAYGKLNPPEEGRNIELAPLSRFVTADRVLNERWGDAEWNAMGPGLAAYLYNRWLENPDLHKFPMFCFERGFQERWKDWTP